MDTYTLIGQTIQNKQQVTAVYSGHYREMCPHVIGWKDGRPHAMFFQFGGTSSRGLSPGGDWRCVDVELLQDVQVRDGVWHTGAGHSRPQTCIDELDVEVDY